MIADQIEQADGVRSLIDMDLKARIQMESIPDLSQIPKMTSTLMKGLILTGKAPPPYVQPETSSDVSDQSHCL